MFERVLLALDGSEHGRKVVPVAVEIAERFGGRVVIVHVREWEVARASAFELETPGEAESLLAEATAAFDDRGIEVETELRSSVVGQVPREILAVAEEREAELIVMGTRGLTEWQGLLLGSVAHKVLHHAACPVLLVR